MLRRFLCLVALLAFLSLDFFFVIFVRFYKPGVVLLYHICVIFEVGEKSSYQYHLLSTFSLLIYVSDSFLQLESLFFFIFTLSLSHEWKGSYQNHIIPAFSLSHLIYICHSFLQERDYFFPSEGRANIIFDVEK